MKKSVLLMICLLAITGFASAQIVGGGYGNGGYTPSRTGGGLSNYTRDKGHYVRIQLGLPQVFTVGYAYMLNDYVMFGAGTGVGMSGYDCDYYRPSFYTFFGNYYQSQQDTYITTYTGSSLNAIPLYGEVEGRLKFTTTSLFINLKFGYNFIFYDKSGEREFTSDDQYGYGIFNDFDGDPNTIYKDYFGKPVMLTETFDYHRFFYSINVGVSASYVNVGMGYSSIYGLFGVPITYFISFDIPVSTSK